MVLSKVCYVDGCNGKLEARGLCNKHYIRLRLNGKVTADQVWRDQTDVERFWSKIAIGTAQECWLWLSPELNSQGYGRFTTYKPKRQRHLAHRYAYLLTHGELSGSAVVMHLCDTPRCCNPAHLRLGTQLDNMRDALVKGRLNLTGLAVGWELKRKQKESSR